MVLLTVERRMKILFLVLAIFFTAATADYIPPPRLDGFVYNNPSSSFALQDTVLIEAYFDPLCPDSRDSWPPLKQALQHYGSSVSLLLHLLPLPYHDNAFVASRALHVVNNLNSSATFPLLEWLFKYQEKFSGAQTRELSRASIVEEIVKVTTQVLGSSYYNSIVKSFSDTTTEIQTRVSFKYAASRGVYGTPFFYVNGFLLPDIGEAIDYNAWRKVIDPLVAANKGTKNEDSIHFFL
ncbi:hypothetical protein RJT34_08822 [Clitoria ternatea]|uniref:Thioredoxin-like fold domain-containing protein n=1 Tax=Clitoria ternatea TaxID=43366 RepID=A0AAN9K679_CLITE